MRIGLGLALTQLRAIPGGGDGGVPAPVNSVAPVITGTAREGQTLSASTGTWSGSPTYAYQWKRGGANIGGATANEYTAVTADVGSVLTVTVTATNVGGSASATSAATSAILPLAPTNFVAPSISGAPEVGQTLTASDGTWTGSPSFAYQWKRDGANIGGATNSTYLLVLADVNAAITVTVTGTNGGGSASATSAATATVVPQGTADLRAYIAGDVPMGLYPRELSGRAEILSGAISPQALCFN